MVDGRNRGGKASAWTAVLGAAVTFGCGGTGGSGSSGDPVEEVGTTRQAVVATSQAATITADATISGGAATMAVAQAVWSFAGETNNSGSIRTLLKFSLPATPAGQALADAVLTLNITKFHGAGNYALGVLTKDWGEGNGSTPARVGDTSNPFQNYQQAPVVGDPTWTYARWDGSGGTAVAWTTPGGDFTASATPSFSVPAAVGAFQVSVRADVQGWLTTPSTNHGWILKGTGSPQYARAFGTSEGGNPAQLTLKYCAASADPCKMPAVDASGNCIVQNSPDNTTCAADTNACTRDVCTAGVCTHPSADGISCTATYDPNCQNAPTCQASQCKVTNKADGTGCAADTNQCTRDVCAAGQCTHPSADGIPCTKAYDTKCQNAPTCQASQCTVTNKVDGTVCDADGNLCTQSDACTAGACVAGPQLDCSAGAVGCQTNPGACNPATGNCEFNNYLAAGKSCISGATPGTCDAAHNCTAVAVSQNLYGWGASSYGQLGNGVVAQNITSAQPVPGLTGIVATAGGVFHTVALDSSGDVWTAGRNIYGALGDSTFTGNYRTTFTKLAFFGGWATGVAAGDYHGLALLSDGTVDAWGLNANGQLGSTGGDTLGTDPRLVTGLSHVVAVAAGGNHSLALTAAGEVWAWGDTVAHGGSPTVAKMTLPVLARAVAAGSQFSIALGVNGIVYTWGAPITSPGGAAITTPTAVLGMSDIRAIAAAEGNALGVAADGTAYAWGDNAYGQLGFGYTSSNQTWTPIVYGPIQVKTAPNTPLTGVIGVAAGRSSSTALLDDGTVYTWGSNQFGQLGDPTHPDPDTWARKVTGVDSVRALSGSANTVLATRAFDHVLTWGDNAKGELGDGQNAATEAYSAAPGAVSSTTGMVAVKSVASACGNKVALDARGHVWAWGDNTYGQIGSSTDATRPFDQGISHVMDVAAGCFYTAALKSDGTVWVWGFGLQGVLGNGSTASNSSTPVQVKNQSGAPSLFRIMDIEAKGGDIIAIDVGGAAWAWGANMYHQTGSSSTSNLSLPFLMVSNARAAGAGLYTNYVLLADGTVRTYGLNADFELGQGQVNPNALGGPLRSTAGASSNETNVSSVTGGYRFGLAITDGFAIVWGRNNEGQFGMSTPTNSSIPIQVPSYPIAVELSGGWYTSVARSTFGTAYATGRGNLGGLGTGNTNPTSDWTPIVGITRASKVVAGRDSGIALTP